MLRCCRGSGSYDPQLALLSWHSRTNTTAVRRFAALHPNCLRLPHSLNLESDNIAKAWCLPKSYEVCPPRALQAPDSPARDAQGQFQMIILVNQLNLHHFLLESLPFQEFEHQLLASSFPSSHSSSSKSETHSVQHSQYMDRKPGSFRWCFTHSVLQPPESTFQGVSLPCRQFLDASGWSSLRSSPWNGWIQSTVFQLGAEWLSLVGCPCWRHPWFEIM